MKRTIEWTKIKELLSPNGNNENVGTSNMLCTFLEDKIILGNTNNFEHNEIYLIKYVGDNFKIIDYTLLANDINYGKCVVFNNNIVFYIGCDKIIKINIINNRLHISEYFSLPFNIKNCIAHQFEGIIYYGLGEIDGKITNKMFSFNIYTKENIELTPFPASERTLAISEIFFDDIVVFSGGNIKTYIDGYKFNVRKKIWQTISDVEIQNQKISLLGASSTKISSQEMLVIGGFSSNIWANAKNKLATLKGDEKEKFKQFYFNKDYKYYNWNKEILIYNYMKDEWKSIGEVSFEATYGNALINTGLNIYSIMGEIKPKKATPNIYKIALQTIKEKINNS